MRIIDPGHKFAFQHLDGSGEEILSFVKREGEKYPGNVGSYPGTNMQEVLRGLISRTKYLHGQDPHWLNTCAIDGMRIAIRNFEYRAAERHGRVLIARLDEIENYPVCSCCGHIGHDGKAKVNG